MVDARMSELCILHIILFVFFQLWIDVACASNPCAVIASSFIRSAKEQGKARAYGIPGQLAHDCLRSMPFRSDLAVSFLDEYAKYLQFQSTTAILKDPPSGYISTGVDLWGQLQTIRQKANDNAFASHFDFDSELRYLISRANDGHLTLNLCSQGILHFEHEVPLVSISSDGREVPEIYTYHDARLKFHDPKSDVSPVVLVDGLDPSYYLQSNIGVTISLQDPDARYNHLFPNHAAAFSGSYTGGAWTSHLGAWPGAAHQTFEFGNGTQLTFHTTASASLNPNWDYSSGTSLFESVCIPKENNSLSSKPRRAPSSADPVLSAVIAMYPSPIVRHRKDLIRGYYLTDPKLKDVAILQVPTFKLDGESPRSFDAVALNFLDKARKDGKQKLIIDLSSNDGGDINLGFNLFRLLFPDKSIYTATRFPSTELINLMGRIFSFAQGREALGEDSLDLPLVFHNAVTPDHGRSFESWEELFGPEEVLGRNMSRLLATYNFTTASQSENPISGYGGISVGPVIQPFETYNIILLTNGACVSTCSILANLLKHQGVKSIVFGGRPRPGPMQAIGGNKGGQCWSLETIDRYVRKAQEIAEAASREESPILTAEEMERLKELAPPPLEQLSLRLDERGAGGVNFRDEYSEEDSALPLQFVYDAADCRLFYTMENYVVPESTWRDAADAMFYGGLCVEGSRGVTAR